MDILELDPIALENAATCIEGYCILQKKAIDEFFQNASTVQSEWNDDQTIGKLMLEIRSLQNQVNDLMDEIKAKYPAYFREKASEIRNRPTC